MFSASKQLIFAIALLAYTKVYGIEEGDQKAILSVVEDYTEAWNDCRGYGSSDGFTEDAPFVNVFGMCFKGRDAIEEKHVEMLGTFLKHSKLQITKVDLKEIKADVVIGLIYWKLNGTEFAKSLVSQKLREGIFTQVFVKSGESWEIATSQNTLTLDPKELLNP